MKSSVVCRLSPNEEVALLRHHRDERRRARLVQVREQERLFARKVREEVKGKREEERRVLEQHLQVTLEATHQSEMRELEEKYLTRVGHIGQGHRDAQHINEEESRVQELRMLLAAKQRHRAQERHTAAMKELTVNQLHEKERRQRVQEAKKCALEAEKQRAKEGATRCLSAPTLIMDLAVDRGQRVRLKEVEGFSSSYYHIPHSTVQRMATPDHTVPSAHQLAQAVMEEDKKLGEHSATVRIEQGEKAWLRHKHAMAKVRLEKEKSEVMKELKALDRQNRSHRQKALGSMPANMFQPVHRRSEMASEQQKDMEQAFEKLFVKTHGVHTHSALSSITDRTSPERRRSHDQSGLTTLPHPTEPPTYSVSPTIEKSLDVSPAPVSPALVGPKLHLEVPTAATASSGLSKTPDLSISDVTPSELVPAQQSLDSVRRPPVAGRDEEHRGQPVAHQLEQANPAQQRPLGRDEDHRRQPVAGWDGDHRRQPGAGRDEEHQRRWVPMKSQPKGQETLPLSRRGEGMQKLVSMIRSQHQAWTERLATRSRLLSESPEPSHGNHTSSNQHEPLSIHTLLSSRDTTIERQPQVSRDEGPTTPAPEDVTSSTTPEPLSITAYETTLDQGEPHQQYDFVPCESNDAIDHHLTTTDTSLPSSTVPMQALPRLQMYASQHTPAYIHPYMLPYGHYYHPLATSIGASHQHMPDTQGLLDGSSLSAAHTPDTHGTIVDSSVSAATTTGDEIPGVSIHADTPETTYMESLLLPDVYMYNPPLQSQDVIDPSVSDIESYQLEVQESRPPEMTTPQLSLLTVEPHLSYNVTPPLFHPPDITATSLATDASGFDWHRPGTQVPERLTHVHDRLHPGTQVHDRLTQVHDRVRPGTQVPDRLTQVHDRVRPGTQVHERLTQVHDRLHPSTRDTPSPQSTESHTAEESPSFLSDEAYGRKKLMPDHQRDSHLFDSGVVMASTSSATLSAKSSQEKAVPASAQPPSSTSLQDVFLQRGAQPPSSTSLQDAFLQRGAQLPSSMSLQDAFLQRGAQLPSSTSLQDAFLQRGAQPPSSTSLQDAFLQRGAQPPSSTGLQDAFLQKGAQLPSSMSLQDSFLQKGAQLPSSTTLQDAFLRKRQDFIKHSQSRQKQVEANARERRIQAATSPQLHGHNARERRIQAATSPQLHGHKRLGKSTKPNQCSHRDHRKEATKPPALDATPGEGCHKKPAVTFSSPLYQSEHTGIFTPPDIHRGRALSQKREKITSREMKERNLRFYSRLPEVRQRKKEERVAQQNAANRERAKQYHQKIRGLLQQKDSRKLTNLTKYSAPEQASNQTRSMPPFK